MTKPHKHAELIKAWADGAKIQVCTRGFWLTDDNPRWLKEKEYRIKAEPKPDVERSGSIYFSFLDNDWEESSGYRPDNIKFRFDGETGELKSAEVIK